jgi:hypothetical protein
VTKMKHLPIYRAPQNRLGDCYPHVRGWEAADILGGRTYCITLLCLSAQHPQVYCPTKLGSSKGFWPWKLSRLWMVHLENVLEVSINRTSEQCVVILKNTVTSSQARADFQPHNEFKVTRGSHTKTVLATSRGFVGLVAVSLWLLEFFVIFGLHISEQGTPMKIETLHPFRQALRSSQSAVMMTLSDIKEFDGDKSLVSKEAL